MSCMALQTTEEGEKIMDMEEIKINVRATRLWNVLRIVVVMLRKGIATKKLQKMAVDLQMAISKGIKFGGLEKYVSNGGGYHNKSIQFNNHYEFSCSSTPMVKRAAMPTYSGLRKHSGRWDQRFLMATMPCIAKEAESVIHSTIPKFIQCGEDYFDPCQRSSSTPSYVSTRSELSEVDKQAEEFIASFYNQMRLQRQDSYSKYSEMLARGSG